MALRKQSGEAEFSLNHPCGLQIRQGLPEPAVRNVDGVASRDMGTGYVWYDLPKTDIAGHQISISLCYRNANLESIRVADVNANYGSGWAEWTAEKERSRADATQRWLAAIGYELGAYSWGVVWAGTDPKTGDGGGTVTFGRL